VAGPEPGRIILLNGASSSGKSTLVRALQPRLETPFWHVSSDQLIEAHVLPERREDTGPFSWAEMRPRFFDAFHRCIPALAAAGNDLVVEHVIEFQSWMRSLLELLHDFDVFFVGVHCPAPELARRERARGDRQIGEGLDHLEVVHSFGSYDVEVDTHATTAPDNARIMLDAWRARRLPSAFERIRSGAA